MRTLLADIPPVSSPSLLYGTYWNADGLANLEVGGQGGGEAGRSVAYRFRAEASGVMTAAKIYLVFRTICAVGCYASGDGGDIQMEVRTDDGTSNHFPSSTVLGSALVTDPLQGTFNRTFTLSQPVTLTAGVLYHLVFVNTSPDPAHNYTSVDMLYCENPPSPMQPGYSDTDLAVVFKHNGSVAWAPNDKTPIFTLYYQDGTHHGPGAPYVNARSSSLNRPIAGANRVRQTFTVSGGDKSVTKVFVRLLKTGSPGSLTIRLERGDQSLIEQGVVPASAVNTTPGWVSYSFTNPRTLVNGQTYHLVLSAPAGDAYSTWPLTQGTVYGFDAPNGFSDGYWQDSDDSGGSWNSSGADDMQMYFVLGQ